MVDSKSPTFFSFPDVNLEGKWYLYDQKIFYPFNEGSLELQLVVSLMWIY